MSQHQTQTPIKPFRVESTLQNMLEDPLTRLVAESDGLVLEDLTDLMHRTRTRLLAERWRHSPSAFNQPME